VTFPARKCVRRRPPFRILEAYTNDWYHYQWGASSQHSTQSRPDTEAERMMVATRREGRHPLEIMLAKRSPARQERLSFMDLPWGCLI
jgi:hypothetical protein